MENFRKFENRAAHVIFDIIKSVKDLEALKKENIVLLNDDKFSEIFRLNVLINNINLTMNQEISRITPKSAICILESSQNLIDHLTFKIGESPDFSVFSEGNLMIQMLPIIENIRDNARYLVEQSFRNVVASLHKQAENSLPDNCIPLNFAKEALQDIRDLGDEVSEMTDEQIKTHLPNLVFDFLKAAAKAQVANFETLDVNLSTLNKGLA